MNEYDSRSVTIFIVWKTDLSIGSRTIVEIFTSKINAEAFAFRQWSAESKPSSSVFDVQEYIALSH